MISTLHIDWLSLTFPIADEKSAKRFNDIRLWHDILAPHFTIAEAKWRVSKPLFGYSEAYISEHGVQAMYGRAEMGLHIIYSGQALQALNNAGIDTERVIKNAIQLGARATRADVAMDIYNGKATVGTYTNALKSGHCSTGSKQWRTMENALGGFTLYIGSRSSERMVRIYDKKAERAAQYVTVSSDSWIRAEVELKGDRARDFLRACKDNALTDVMNSHLIATVDFPKIPEWMEATRNGAKFVVPTETKRKTTKTREWLIKTVAPILARECAQDGLFLTDFQTEVYAIIEQTLNNFNSTD